MEAFRPNAEEIRYCAKKLLNDGKKPPMEELRNHIKKYSPNGAAFTGGMSAGAVYDLVKNGGGKYSNPARGYYQMIQAHTADEEMCQKIVSILEKTNASMEEACTRSIIGLSEREVKLAEKAGEIIRYLENRIKAIKKEYRIL